MQITKRNGLMVLFDNDKIAGSILKANAGMSGELITNSMALGMAQEVCRRAAAESNIITTADIRRNVTELLRERGLYKTAENYRAFAERK